MTKPVQIVGHATLTLDDISPSKSASYSPNLHAYLKTHGHFFTDGGLLDAVYITKPDTSAASWFGQGTLMVGHWDGGLFIGTRLNAALCNGAGASRAAYGCGTGIEQVEGFWEDYLRIGRCAIDPAHVERFIDDRFREQADGRECLWCGLQQRKVITARVVHDTTWTSELTRQIPIKGTNNERVTDRAMRSCSIIQHTISNRCQ